MRKPIAKDGLVARDSGDWAEKKLRFLDDFAPAAIQATARKRHRYYIDLFAGPGINVMRGKEGIEFEGSPLRVLRYAGIARNDLTFTHAVFANADERDHEALEKRIDNADRSGSCKIPRNNIHLVNGDANVVVTSILKSLPVSAYALIFADIEAPRQWPWSSTKQIRAFGHESIDFYMLFPLDMAINRLLSYSRPNVPENVLTKFFGTDEWKFLWEKRFTSAQSPQLRKEIVDLYVRQLGTLWKTAGKVLDVRYRGRHNLYKMLFASDHLAGDRIAKWVGKHQNLGKQGDFFT